MDIDLVNPQKRNDFVIMGVTVPIPKDNPFPFAVLSAGQVLVFWCGSQWQREHWVTAIRSLAVPAPSSASGENGGPAATAHEEEKKE